MKSRRRFIALFVGMGSFLSAAGNEAQAQATVSAECVAQSGPICTFVRFLISSDVNPVSLTVFEADLAAASSWIFAGGPSGTFTAEDDFSFGVPYGGSTSITNGGLSIFIAFTSPTFELAPFSSGAYIEAAMTGSGDTSFNYTLEDPDGGIASGESTLTDLAAPPVDSTPEPATIWLVVSGVAGVARFATRRARIEH